MTDSDQHSISGEQLEHFMTSCRRFAASTGTGKNQNSPLGIADLLVQQLLEGYVQLLEVLHHSRRPLTREEALKMFSVAVELHNVSIQTEVPDKQARDYFQDTFDMYAKATTSEVEAMFQAAYVQELGETEKRVFKEREIQKARQLSGDDPSGAGIDYLMRKAAYQATDALEQRNFYMEVQRDVADDLYQHMIAMLQQQQGFAAKIDAQKKAREILAELCELSGYNTALIPSLQMC